MFRYVYIQISPDLIDIFHLFKINASLLIQSDARERKRKTFPEYIEE